MKNLFTAFNPRRPIIGEVGDKIHVFVRPATFFDYKNAYLLTPNGEPYNGSISIASPAVLPQVFLPGTESFSQDLFDDLPASMTATVVSVGEIEPKPGLKLRALAVSFDGMDEHFSNIKECREVRYPTVKAN